MTFAVAPPVGAWIEIKAITLASVTIPVAPPVGAWIEIVVIPRLAAIGVTVAPPVGAWIEIPVMLSVNPPHTVAPPVGAWIEIACLRNSFAFPQSLPPWERGLKFLHRAEYFHSGQVAPPVGAWIEIISCIASYIPFAVAPPVGAWIEISTGSGFPWTDQRSLPPWERGLKSIYFSSRSEKSSVAPPVGAWIEIYPQHGHTDGDHCRSPRGSVD